MSKRSRLELIIEVDHNENTDPMSYFNYTFDSPLGAGMTREDFEIAEDLNDSIFLVSEAWEDVS